MNKVFLIGNLTKDPEARTTTTGKKMITFSIAVNDGKDSNGQELVQYFTIKGWDRQAEIVEQYVKKGHKVAVTGKIVNRKWDKPDGTTGYTTEISMMEVELLTSRNEAERLNTMSANTQQSTNANSNPTPAPVKTTTTELPSIDVNDLDIKVQMPF
jgi:single-strand DNA-binding protein